MRYFVMICTIILLIFTFGCTNDGENPIGYNLVKSNGELDTLLIQSPNADTYFHAEKSFLMETNKSTGGAPSLYVGAWNDYIARTLIKADFDAILQDTSATNKLNSLKQVIEAKLTLRYAGELGEGELELRVYEVLEAWSEYYSSWENADHDSIYTTWTTPGGVFSSEPIFTTTISDTLDSLEIILPNSIIETWIEAYHDTSGVYNNYGIILIADDATCMKEFHSREAIDSELHPILTFDYEYESGNETEQSTATLQIDKPTNQGADTFISNKPFEEPNGTENTITISNGFFIRGVMKFEIPTSIPKDATINLAELTINIITDEESFTDDMFVRAYALKEEWQEDGFENSEPELYILKDAFGVDISPGTSISLGDSVVTLHINSWVQQWINNPKENFGLLLRSGSEALNFSSFEIYSRESSEDLRPNLKITYTLPPTYEW